MPYHRMQFAPEFTWIVRKSTGKDRSVKYPYRTFATAMDRAEKIAHLHSLDPNQVISIAGNHITVNCTAYFGSRRELSTGSATPSASIMPNMVGRKFR